MYFPLFLNVSGVRFLVVGAGKIALAKLETILEFAANVTVISKESTSQIIDLDADGQINLISDSYDKKHLELGDVIIAATDDNKINEQISQDARSLGKLVNAVDDAGNSDFIFGANVKRGDIILSVATGGTSPVLARILKQKFASALPINLHLLSDFIGKNRLLVKEKLTNLQARRLFWQGIIEGVVSNEVLNGNLEKAQTLLEKELERYGNRKEAAVYFIGAGPGDPELITIKAINLLSKADVVLYDRLVSREILAYARKDALKINVGKTRDLHRYTQVEINDLIKKYALQGNIVARLKGGDATLFAHLSEEIDAIAGLNIAYQIVPGISAAFGAAAYPGIPLTSRNSNKSVRFLTIYKNNLVDKKYWKELAKTEDNLVLYMSSHNLSKITAALVKAGKNKKTPIAVIEQATTNYQKTYLSTIGDFAKEFGDKKFVSPSLVMIGDVVNQHKKYKWKEENLNGSYFQDLLPVSKNIEKIPTVENVKIANDSEKPVSLGAALETYAKNLLLM